MIDFYKYFQDEKIKVYTDNDEDIKKISDIADSIVAYQFSAPGAMGWGGICVAIDDKGNIYPLNFLHLKENIEKKNNYII